VGKFILSIAALFALGIASADAEEMATPPSAFITARVPYLAWSGFYVGINGGFGWGNSSVSYTPNDPAAQAGIGTAKSIGQVGIRRDGPLAGGQVGFNWQVNSLWLVGAEADYQWSNLNGTAYSPFHLTGVAGLSTFSANQTVQSFGTFRARMGVTPFDSLLLYGTGGLAVGEVNENLNLTGATGGTTALGFSYRCFAGGTACFSGAPSQIRVGWTAGAGAEYAITTNITFKTEILYVHLQAPNATATATALNTVGTTPSSFTANFPPVYFAIVRGGLNYRF
jgi:outer membrane immunogenic protein